MYCGLLLPALVTWVCVLVLQIELCEGRLLFMDLGSSNGTFLNGKLVGGAAIELATGDKLIVGYTELVVTLTTTGP